MGVTIVSRTSPRYASPERLSFLELRCTFTERLLYILPTTLTSPTRIIFQGYLNVDPWSFGSQWGAIVGLLAHPYAFPKLRRLVMEVHARVLNDEGEAMRVSNLFEADSLLSTIERNVYPAYLSQLEELCKQGRRVEFAFRAFKEEGPRLR